MPKLTSQELKQKYRRENGHYGDNFDIQVCTQNGQ